MFTIGQEVSVRFGDKWLDGTVENKQGSYYLVWLFDVDKAGWFYYDIIQPQNQVPLDIDYA